MICDDDGDGDGAWKNLEKEAIKEGLIWCSLLAIGVKSVANQSSKKWQKVPW